MRGCVITMIMVMLLVCSCKIRHPSVASAKAQSERTPITAALHPEDFNTAFRKILKNKSDTLISNYYKKRTYKPVFITRFLADRQLQVFLSYLMNSGQHGLEPEQFFAETLKKQLTEVEDHNSSTNLAKLELTIAHSLLKYSMAMQFGVVNPNKIYNNYAIVTKMPDSATLLRVFEVQNLKHYLDSIQPKDKRYLALQKALITLRQEQNSNKEQIEMLVINLERLRWKNKPPTQKYVLVNIADFSLDVMDNGKSILHMKVCVGEPNGKETPQLSSTIHSVQVNPVWNIPQSIARNEIAKHANEDRYYLANNNINVYHQGKLIRDVESINWTVANLNDYSFQQQPGAENALGKIKFLFNNQSSVYLHDTPIQAAFNQEIRAVSHGCVRVQKPLELAYALFGKSEKYNQIKRAMQSGYPRAKFIGLAQQLPIQLTYYTTLVDNAGKVRFCKDVYGLDRVLYVALQK